MASAHGKRRVTAPKSANTVRVRMIDTTAIMTLHSRSFIQPVVPGHEKMGITDVAFLIENEHLDKKAIFDLGVRKDFWNFSPKIRQRLDAILTGLKVDRNVSDVIQEGGLSLDQINDVMWSHSHWDHTGDPSLFPSTTNLVYGPGISSSRPAYPTNKDSPLLETAFSGRNNHEIDFDSSPLTIGGFKAYDFYDDGSFYLLETPGHSKGHMCGLARTTTTTTAASSGDEDDESTFILFGGDVCHFCGDLRPNETYPLPSSSGSGSTGDDLLKRHPQFDQNTEAETEKRSTTPWYKLSTDSKTAYDFPNPQVAQNTVDNLRRKFDEAENVLVALAHDTSLLDVVPVFNDRPESDLNDWMAKGWKGELYWKWVAELDRKEDIVSGFWRDGVRYEKAADLIEDVGKSSRL